MAQFGNCTKVGGSGNTTCGTPTFIRVLKLTAPENAEIEKVSAYVGVSGNPACTDADGKALIYSDNGGAPNELLGISQITNWLKTAGAGWRDFNFSPVIIVPAGDYWIGITGPDACPVYQDILATGGETYSKTDGGGDFYDNPPDPFPAGGGEGEQKYWVCITYTLSTNPYPVGLLKKGLITAYHCFMSAYILAKKGGYDPLKLPDGTIF